MTSTQPGGFPVDLDLLADYVEGLLPPEESARVEALVEHEEVWSSTLTALTAALPSVTTALAGYAADRPAMPADITARIAATIGGLAAERTPTDAPPAPTDQAERTPTEAPPVPTGQAEHTPTEAPPSFTGQAEHSPAGVQPIFTGHQPTSRPGDNRPAGRSARRAGRSRWSAGRSAVFAAAALIVLVFGGLAVVNHQHGTNDESSHTTAAAGRANVTPKGPQVNDGGTTQPVLIASGTDYTRALLKSVPSTPGPIIRPQETATGESGLAPDSVPIPAPLSRLGDRAALDACLGTVETTIGGTATIVDYASFDGTPALIITLSGINLVIAVGADCGLSGAGTDELARQ